MEEIVTCSICKEQFDSLHFIPKLLECGHTFCSPCLIEVFENNPVCPNCRKEMKGIESSLPIDHMCLALVEFYNSVDRSEDIVTSIEDMKKKFIEGKLKFWKKKDQIYLSLRVYDECLAKLEDVTAPESSKVDYVNVDEILNEVQHKILKAIRVMASDDIKSFISIRLSSFENSEAYLIQILKRIENEEKVFAVKNIGGEVKYGKVSSHEKKLYFHSLSTSQVPNDSFLIWFEELKQCANEKNFYTFLKISCIGEMINRVLIIKMLDKQMSHHFIKLCTGENGPSYKGTPYKRGVVNEAFKSILKVENFIENGCQTNRVIDFNFSVEDYDYDLKVGEFYLLMPSKNGDFEILHTNKTVKAGGDVIGRIISPMTLNDCINYDHSSSLKIINSGIILEV